MTTNRRGATGFGIDIDEPLRPASLSGSSAVEARRAALLRLDPMVRRLLHQLRAGPLSGAVELTAYDVVYAATPAIGGH